MHAVAIDGTRYAFPALKGLLAKASPLRSGDRLAGIAAQSAAERVAAHMALASRQVSRGRRRGDDRGVDYIGARYGWGILRSRSRGEAVVPGADKRLISPYRSGSSQDWIKVKDPDSPAMRRARAGLW